MVMATAHPQVISCDIGATSSPGFSSAHNPHLKSTRQFSSAILESAVSVLVVLASENAASIQYLLITVTCSAPLS